MSKLFPSEEHLPDFKKQCLHFMRLLDGVVVKLMQCFALALDLPSDHFTREMSPDDDDNGTALFFNRYPSVEGKTFPADAVRDGSCSLRCAPDPEFRVSAVAHTRAHRLRGVYSVRPVFSSAIR
jgi:hypothetical protein